MIYAGVVLIAALFRFTALTTLPYTLWVDEAWFEFRGQEVLQGINLWPTVDPVFASGNSPFQIYATALVQALGHPPAYASRWVSAIAGVLSVALLYPFLLNVLPDNLAGSSRNFAALVGAAGMATLFASLVFSRDGRQNATCTAIAILVGLGLYKALERLDFRWASLTGCLLALALTTYEAALALPILVIAYTLIRGLLTGETPAPTGCSRLRTRALSIFQTSSKRRSFLIGGAILLTALVVYLPLLIYYLAHPEVMLNRLSVTGAVGAQQGISALPGMTAQALVGYGRVWSGIAFQGDAILTQNIPGRPLFDPFIAGLFGIGLVGTAAQIRKSAGAQLLLLWVAVMALPSAVTQSPPAFTRSLPMTVGLLGLAGLGAGLATTYAQRWGGRASQWGTAILIGAGLIFSGVNTLRDYLAWTTDPEVFEAFHAYGRYTIERALELARSGEVLLTPGSAPVLVYPFAITLNNQPAIKVFDASPNCLPYPHRRATPTTYGVIQVMDAHTLPALKLAYPNGVEAATIMHQAGYAYAVFYQVPPGTPAPAPAHEVNVGFAGGLQLTGYDLPDQARPGETLTLTLHWQTTQLLTENLVGFAHLGKGANSQPLIGNHDEPLCPNFPTSRWEKGYVYIEKRAITLGADAPPDLYDLRVGVYRPLDKTRLATVSADAPTENNRVILAPLKVEVR